MIHFRPTTMFYIHGVCEWNSNIIFQHPCTLNSYHLLHVPQILRGLSDLANVNIERNILIPFTYGADLKRLYSKEI